MKKNNRRSHDPFILPLLLTASALPALLMIGGPFPFFLQVLLATLFLMSFVGLLLIPRRRPVSSAPAQQPTPATAEPAPSRYDEILKKQIQTLETELQSLKSNPNPEASTTADLKTLQLQISALTENLHHMTTIVADLDTQEQWLKTTITALLKAHVQQTAQPETPTPHNRTPHTNHPSHQQSNHNSSLPSRTDHHPMTKEERHFNRRIPPTF